MAVLAGLVAGCGGHGSHTAKSNSVATYTPAPKPPPVPCATPSSGGPDTTGSTTPGTAPWSGVFEKVTAKLDQSGAVKGTPEQITRVSVVGNSPVTVAVPVTSTSVHKKDKGGRPQVANRRARINLDPNGTAVQKIKSAFNHALPVAVAVSYSLDGKAVSGKHLGRKTGTLEIHYKLSNVTSESLAACFKGFDGRQQHLTVSAPVPIVASLSLTVPSNATGFEAPGASLSSDRKGVSVGWTPSLFEPLGATSQTFTLKMTMKHPSVPKVSLYLFTVDPRVLAGSAPAKTATVVGNATADQAEIVASLQRELDALQKRVANLSTAPPARSNSTTAATRTAPMPARTLASTDHVTPRKALEASLGDLKASIATLLKLHARMSHKAAALLALAVRVRDDATAVTTQLHDTAAQLNGPVQNALAAVQQLEQLKTDLGSFGADVKSTPAYAKVLSDLQVAQSTADELQSSLANAKQRAQSATSGLASLEADLASLETTAAATATAAKQAADSTAQKDLTEARAGVVGGIAELERELSSTRAALAKTIATKKAAAKRRVTKTEADVRRAAAKEAQQALHSIETSLAAAQAQLTKIDGQIKSDLADANVKYARILALNELAVLNQLPGGSASGATTQNGRFAITIG